jgi:transposase-like protein
MGMILEAEAPFLDNRMRELLDVGFHQHLSPAQLAARDAKRAKDRPLCPECGLDGARTNAGGIKSKARYWRCGECGAKWKVMTEAN